MKSKKPVKTRKLVKTSRLTLLNIKVSAADRAALVRAARKNANGNLSAWLRFAGTTLNRPMPTE